MKILYAIQGTGNGHLGRAIEIGPLLSQQADVDFLISGRSSELNFPLPIKYNYHGLFFIFGNRGGIDYSASFAHLKPMRLIRDIRLCPVEKYDLIISDFESISAWAGRRKKVPVLGISHQAAFYSDKIPLPQKRRRIYEYGMKHWVAPCEDFIGIHYRSYDENIVTPIIRQEMIDGEKLDKGHVTVYLPAYADEILIKHFHSISEMQWHVFSKKTKKVYRQKNVTVNPVSKTAYKTSLLSSHGLLTGGGFQATSEGLYLNKKMLVIPMWDQYEQQCNAAALELEGVQVEKKIETNFSDKLKQWLYENQQRDYNVQPDTESFVHQILAKAKKMTCN